MSSSLHLVAYRISQLSERLQKIISSSAVFAKNECDELCKDLDLLSLFVGCGNTSAGLVEKYYKSAIQNLNSTIVKNLFPADLLTEINATLKQIYPPLSYFADPEEVKRKEQERKILIECFQADASDFAAKYNSTSD